MPTVSQSSGSTSPSLLGRVQGNEPQAWERFVVVYAPLVYVWARRGGLQQSDAEDVVQDVFRTVFTSIGDFQKDGQQSRFRGWLWVITRNRVRLLYRQRAPQEQAAGGSQAALLAQIPDLWQREEDPSTPDDNRALVRRALVAVKVDFSDSTWQAFWATAIDGRSAADVAGDLSLSPTAVRQAKFRVLCRLREELADL